MRFSLCAFGAMWGLSAPTIAPGDHVLASTVLGATLAHLAFHGWFPPLPPLITRHGSAAPSRCSCGGQLRTPRSVIGHRARLTAAMGAQERPGPGACVG